MKLNFLASDSKTIARNYLVFGISMLFLGGFFALLMRWQLAFPGKPLPLVGILFPDSMIVEGIILPEFYAALFTLHGTFMIFFAVIPILVNGLSSFIIPLQIGAKDMAFPRLNGFAFWLYPIAVMMILSGFFLEGGPARSGWTSYAPLSRFEPGQASWILGVFLTSVASVLVAINTILTIVMYRSPGLFFSRLPLTIWAYFWGAWINLFSSPVLAIALVMLSMDRFWGTHFFDAVKGGEPLLWQHLFWFYAHPAVYLMILPGMGIVSDVLSVFSRKPVFGYRAMVLSMAAISILGFLVWGHHMFQSGMNPWVGTTFMLSSMLIALPSGIEVFNWLMTLWKGSIRLKPPMLFALAFISMFIIGGLSGIFLASAPVDMYLHDTYFIVAHLHYVLFGGSFFSIFVALYYWYPKMTGKMLSESLCLAHFWLTFLAFHSTFFPMHILGIGGMMRRLYDATGYAYLAHFQPLQIWISVSALVLGLSQLLLVWNLIWSRRKGRMSQPNPWQANTLEWSENWSPVLRGPYEFSLPGRRKDWTAQNENINL